MWLCSQFTLNCVPSQRAHLIILGRWREWRSWLKFICIVKKFVLCSRVQSLVLNFARRPETVAICFVCKILI